MADKVKLTPPMTDSKTPEWAREAAQAFHDKWETGMSGAAFRDFAQALLSAYERGRKEGIEEAAKVAANYYDHVPDTLRDAQDPVAVKVQSGIANAIRQLLEVKSEDRVKKPEKT